MGKERIEHEGTVVAVDKDYISVEILNKSACAACHAKAVCGASDQAVKVVEVAQDISTLAADYQVGETVNVVMSSAMGTQAIWLAYVVPLIVLMASAAVAFPGCRSHHHHDRHPPRHVVHPHPKAPPPHARHHKAPPPPAGYRRAPAPARPVPAPNRKVPPPKR